MRNKKLKTVLLVLIILLAIAFLISLVHTILEDKRYAEDEITVAAIRDMVVKESDNDELVLDDNTPVAGSEELEKTLPDDENLLREIDFEYLQSINSDAERWIYIPDTNIDYYVMQERVKGQFYYLWRDIYGQRSSWGSIFTPRQEEGDAHTIIFGHHMMTHEYAFATITNYSSYDFAAEHPYVYLYYPDHAEKWAVCCAGHVYNNDIVYETPYLQGSEEYEELLQHLHSISEVEMAEMPSHEENILVLSTCHRAWGGASGRFIVVCKLIDTFPNVQTSLHSSVEDA